MKSRDEMRTVPSARTTAMIGRWSWAPGQYTALRSPELHPNSNSVHIRYAILKIMPGNSDSRHQGRKGLREHSIFGRQRVRVVEEQTSQAGFVMCITTVLMTVLWAHPTSQAMETWHLIANLYWVLGNMFQGVASGHLPSRHSKNLNDDE